MVLLFECRCESNDFILNLIVLIRLSFPRFISNRFPQNLVQFSLFQVRKMENLILKVLEFDLYVPTILSFLDRYEKAADVPEDSRRKFKFLTGVC